MKFLLNVILYYLTLIIITYFWLNSNYVSCARSVVNSLSSSETMFQLNECAQTSEMGDTHIISSGLWLQHPDLYPLNYKICIKIQQRVFVRKIHNVNWSTLWYGWHGFEQRIINNVTDEWCKRLWVCVYVKHHFLSIQFDWGFYICSF